MFAFIAGLVAPVLAQDARLIAVDGPPLPGEHVEVLVALSQADGFPLVTKDAPALTPDHGEVVRSLGELDEGLWRYIYRAPLAEERDTIAITFPGTNLRRPLVMGTLPDTDVTAPPFIDGRVEDTFEIRLTGEELPPPELLDVRVPEGQVDGVSRDDGGLVVRWRPDGDRFPRSVVLGFRDASKPRVAPAWTVARLRSTATLTDRTDPGTSVEIRIGSRSYGPVVANDEGVAAISVDVRPGEEQGTIERTDDVGNVGRSPISLGGKSQPSMTALVESELLAGQRAPLVHLAAVRPSGGPWGGQVPTCRTSLGDEASVVVVDAGRYVVLLPTSPEDTFFDLRLDCSIGDRARESVRIPVSSAQPSRLVIRPYPVEVSADFPVAQLQAFLENGLGDRLPAAGIEITAEHGEIRLDDPEPATLRGEYVGFDAAPHGEDTITARWNTPDGSGPLWGLDLAVQAESDQLVLRGRAIDVQGRPLEGRTLDLVTPAQTGEVVTGPRGWATATLPIPDTESPWLVQVRGGSLVEQALVFPGSRFGRDPEQADLEESIELPILVGKVREVVLWSDPKTVTAGGETARVHVKLTDRAGNPVTDEEISLSASEGVVTVPKQRPDGAFEATFAPPPDMQRGTVQITVEGHTSNIKASTQLEVVPREVSFAPGVSVGYVLSGYRMTLPWLGLEFDNKVGKGEAPLFVRLTTAVFATETVADDATAGEITQRASVLQLGVSGIYRWDWVRRSAWMGVGVVMAPNRRSTLFDRWVHGLGIGPPGFSITTGYGWRVPSGELQLQASYAYMNLGSGHFGHDTVSGVVTSLGYKVLY